MGGTLAFQSNSNNAWIFNGSNGNLNYNNNRYNSYAARVFRDSCLVEAETYESAPIPLSTLYSWYFRARRGKRRSVAQLLFEADYPKQLRKLWMMLNGREPYVPLDSRGFVLKYPKPREVIHPEFFDRIPQTLWCETIRPYIEKHMDQNSFSCRSGRGAISAVQQLVEYYFEESEGGKEPCVFVSIDQKSFFLHIFKPMVVEMYRNVIDEEFDGSPDMRDFMNWLCRILYLSVPSEHMVRESPVSDWSILPPHKISANLPWNVGVDIGNLIAQLAGNFVSELYLKLFHEYGYGHFVHYTDDVKLVLKASRLPQFLELFIPTLRGKEKDYHLELNEKKTSIQPVSHGVTAFGYFIKVIQGDKVVVYPSKRVWNNFLLRMNAFIERGSGNKYYRLRHKEHLRDSINSYYGLFRQCNAYRLRKAFAERLMASDWSDMIEFADDYKYCRIVRNYTQKAYYVRKNRQFRKHINRYLNDTTRQDQ